MLDGWAKSRFEPLLEAGARRLARAGISANAGDPCGLRRGLLAAAAIAAGQFGLGLVLILLSRLGDGLDGAVAAIRGRTDLGGYLDIVLDFLFYGAIPTGFVLAAPADNAVPGAL